MSLPDQNPHKVVMDNLGSIIVKIVKDHGTLTQDEITTEVEKVMTCKYGKVNICIHKLICDGWLKYTTDFKITI